jgi:hypothetical protein
MLDGHQGREIHERFRELNALANSGALTPLERSELNSHLVNCEECCEAALQYQILTTEGISTIASAYSDLPAQRTWDEEASLSKLLARVRSDQRTVPERNGHPRVSAPPSVLRRIIANSFAQAGLAACLVVAVGFHAYRFGIRAQSAASAGPSSVLPDERLLKLVAEKKSADELLAAQAARLAQLQEQSSREERELAKLRSALRETEAHSNELLAANTQSGGKLQELSQQRDTLNTQLQDANQYYQNVRTELASLRSERDRILIRTTSLEVKIEELTAINRDQERRLKDSEQYLASDRDIRELMGARKLYIADVFDVDSGSRTKKPFGRVFYTQGKSLIFYAFDLDRQRGVVNANTFQVWGQKETAQGEQALPLNLGILYMDNETNRRWVMRFDDPKQLAEIDAVFVTVEPRGGSQKPTTKPFLYALLRNDANHP